MRIKFVVGNDFCCRLSDIQGDLCFCKSNLEALSANVHDGFTFFPLHLDPAAKAISCNRQRCIHYLRAHHLELNPPRSSLSVDTNKSIPPPLHLDPKRSAAIQKMRKQGSASLSKRGGIASAANSQAQIQEAVRLHTYVLEMALARPSWELASIIRDEVAILFGKRTQAYMSMQSWAEGVADAE